MHTALGGAHVVGEGDDGLAVGVVILEGYFYGGVVLHAPHVDHIVVDGCLVLIQPGDVFADAALIAHGVGIVMALPLVEGADL